MAQVDLVSYSSILLWFFFLLAAFYILNYTYLIPFIYSILFVRKSYYISKFLGVKGKFNLFYKYKCSSSSYIKQSGSIKLVKKLLLYV